MDRYQETLALTERLAAAAEAGGRRGTQIEVFDRHALAWSGRGDRTRALDDTPAPGGGAGATRGIWSVFVIEGEAMSALLRLALKERSASAYVRRLLEDCRRSAVNVT